MSLSINSQQSAYALIPSERVSPEYKYKQAQKTLNFLYSTSFNRPIHAQEKVSPITLSKDYFAASFHSKHSNELLHMKTFSLSSSCANTLKIPECRTKYCYIPQRSLVRPKTESKQRNVRRKKVFETPLQNKLITPNIESQKDCKCNNVARTRNLVQSDTQTKPESKFGHHLENMKVLGSELKPMVRRRDSYKEQTIDGIKRKIILQLIKSNQLFINEIVPKDLLCNPHKVTDFIINNYDVIIQANPPKQDTVNPSMPGESIPESTKNNESMIKACRSLSMTKPIKQQKPLLKKASMLPKLSTNHQKYSKAELKSSELRSVKPKSVEEIYSFHRINIAVRAVNEVLYSINKIATPSLSHSMKFLGIQFNKTTFPPKTKEDISTLKEKLNKSFLKILNEENCCAQYEIPCKYYVSNGNNGELVRATMKHRWWWNNCGNEIDNSPNANLVWTQWRKSTYMQAMKPNDDPLFPKLCNHLWQDFELGNKKSLYWNMKKYLEEKGDSYTTYMPLTFHVQEPNDEEFNKFVEAFNSNGAQNDSSKEEVYVATEENSDEEENAKGSQNIWIVKPGEDSNRGCGIVVSNDYNEICSIVKNVGKNRSYILQKYIENPLLIEGRKFDIRCYALITSINGHLKGYYYKEGYLRTSSKPFSLDDFSRMVHLTNEAVQIQFDDFGKFEPGNKMSYSEFQKYLDKVKHPLNFAESVLPQIKVSSIK